jgi:hypothetical protein
LAITISEVDLSQTVTNKEISSTEFAANFGIEGTILKKIGLKFGASLKQTRTSERTVVSSLGSDDLAQDIVEFGDKVIIREEERRSGLFGIRRREYTTREYSTGWVSFSLEPVRVQ